MGMGRIVVGLSLATLLTTSTPVDAKKSAPIPALTDKGLPNVQSVASFALDVDTGEVLFQKNPDAPRDIASTGKIFVAMVARRNGIDLEGLTTITETDAEFAKGGARTRLEVGQTFRNHDLMRAMLIASDNRACTAVARGAGLSPKKLVAEMNALAKELGLRHTHFSDPSGLNGNQSTAREMAKALVAAMKDPVLAEIMGTESITVSSVGKRPRAIAYRNTNHSLRSHTYDVVGGKTGYTSTAGYCLLIRANVGGRHLYMSFLGANEKLTRFGDFGRVAGWLKARASGQGAPARPTPSKSAP